MEKKGETFWPFHGHKIPSVGKVVAMQHIWLIKYENNSDGTY